MTKQLKFLPAYMAMTLMSVNILGPDPADFIFIALTVFIFIFSLKSFAFPHVSDIAKYQIFLFLVLYIVSCTSGYKPVFIYYFICNLSIAISMSHFLQNRDFNIGSSIFFGFLVVNVVGFALWSVEFWPEAVFFPMFRDGRFMGTMGDPNFIGLIAAFSVYHFLDKVIRGKALDLTQTLNILALMVSLAMLLFSQSRSTWAAAAGGLIVYLIASRQILSFKVVIAFFGLAISVMTLATINLGSAAVEVGSVSDRFATILVQNDAAERERFEFLYTRISLDVGLQHPLGVGPGMTFAYTGLTNADGGAIGAHNAYVEIFTENGWLAAIVFLTLMISTWLRLFRLALVDASMNDISCRTILAGLTATALFGMGHDLIGWRLAWIFPSLGVLAAYHKDYAKLSSLWSTGNWQVR